MQINGNGRRLAMLVGGVAAGIVGTKVLPAAFGALSGWRRASTGGDPFALLIADHRRIQSILRDMASESTGSRLERSRLYLMLKRKLAKHALAEEDVVYPIVHEHANGSDESKHLYDEHAGMKILLFEIEHKLMRREDWSEAVRNLTQLIDAHIEEEETVIFPQLRDRLSVDRLPGVSGQISREEALIV